MRTMASAREKGPVPLLTGTNHVHTSTGSARTEPRPLHHTKFRIQPRNAPTQPFAWSIKKRHPHRSPGACRKVDGNSATRTHSLVLRQAQHERSHGLFTTRKFAFSLVMPPTQPFAWSIKKRHPHRSPGASRNTNLTVRLEPVERWTGTPQFAPFHSYFDRLSTNGVATSSGTLKTNFIGLGREGGVYEDTNHDVARHGPVTG